MKRGGQTWVNGRPIAEGSGIMRGMNKPHKARRAFVSLVSLVLLVVVVASCGGTPSLPHATLGHTGADIAGLEYLGGDGPRSLAEARGKVVVLDFWATWCAPCKLSFPVYAQIADDFRGDVVMLGVSVDTEATKEAILAFAAAAHAKFPILWDKDGSKAARYDSDNKLPSTFVIDRAGTVRHYHNGFSAAHGPTIRREIKALLAETAPPAALEAISAWTPAPLICADANKANGEAFARALARCKDDACRNRVQRIGACSTCQLTSCCAEEQACKEHAFPPNSPERAQAMTCTCYGQARSQGHADALTRCGPDNDISRAEATCIATHCAEVCAPQEGKTP